MYNVGMHVWSKMLTRGSGIEDHVGTNEEKWYPPHWSVTALFQVTENEELYISPKHLRTKAWLMLESPWKSYGYYKGKDDRELVMNSRVKSVTEDIEASNKTA